MSFPPCIDTLMNIMLIVEPDEAAVQFREVWDFQPRLIFRGHTYHGDAAEISVSSFSWRNKKKPEFVLAYFTKDSHAITKCYMPHENSVYCAYVFFITLAVFSLCKK